MFCKLRELFNLLIINFIFSFKERGAINSLLLLSEVSETLKRLIVLLALISDVTELV